MTGPTLPLLAARDLARPIAWRDGVPVRGAAFIAAAEALAERLPASGRPVNLCQDRLNFSLALAATLLRGQTALMPPNALPATLAQLREAGGGAGPAYAIADEPGLDAGGLPVVAVGPLAEPAMGAARRAIPQVRGDAVAACLLTSGSTGVPQPHAKPFGPLFTSIAGEAERLAEGLGLPSIESLSIVATVPPQHSYGFESSVLLALLGGAAFDAGRPFYPADIAEALARVPRPRMLVTTPFHLKALLGAVEAGLALPPVDLVLSATAPLSPQLAAAAEAATGGVLMEIYGCTEAGQVATRRTTAGQTWQALPGVRIARVADPAAEGGERFLAHGGHVTEPTALADLLVLHEPLPAERFELLGRANDLIHVAGKRSSLAHLNFQLNRIPGVEDGAFWLPEAPPGEIARPVAFVVARDGLDAAAITAALRREVEPAFVPRRIVFVESLPREATGKLTAGALAAFAATTLGALPATTPATPPAAAAPPGPIAIDVPPDHPAFAGHFPGRPLLPGAALLALVIDAAQRAGRLAAPVSIDQAKFAAPVGPGARLALQLEGAAGAALRFEVRDGATVVASGRFGPAR